LHHFICRVEVQIPNALLIHFKKYEILSIKQFKFFFSKDQNYTIDYLEGLLKQHKDLFNDFKLNDHTFLNCLVNNTFPFNRENN
jgi:hypothetical protein